MSSYKGTINQCESTSLRLCAVVSKLYSKALFKSKEISLSPLCVEDVLFVNKPGGHLLRGLRLFLRVHFSGNVIWQCDIFFALLLLRLPLHEHTQM